MLPTLSRYTVLKNVFCWCIQCCTVDMFLSQVFAYVYACAHVAGVCKQQVFLHMQVNRGIRTCRIMFIICIVDTNGLTTLMMVATYSCCVGSIIQRGATHRDGCHGHCNIMRCIRTRRWIEKSVLGSSDQKSRHWRTGPDHTAILLFVCVCLLLRMNLWSDELLSMERLVDDLYLLSFHTYYCWFWLPLTLFNLSILWNYHWPSW